MDSLEGRKKIEKQTGQFSCCLSCFFSPRPLKCQRSPFERFLLSDPLSLSLGPPSDIAVCHQRARGGHGSVFKTPRLRFDGAAPIAEPQLGPPPPAASAGEKQVAKKAPALNGEIANKCGRVLLFFFLFPSLFFSFRELHRTATRATERRYPKTTTEIRARSGRCIFRATTEPSRGDGGEIGGWGGGDLRDRPENERDWGREKK